MKTLMFDWMWRKPMAEAGDAGGGKTETETETADKGKGDETETETETEDKGKGEGEEDKAKTETADKGDEDNLEAEPFLGDKKKTETEDKGKGDEDKGKTETEDKGKGDEDKPKAPTEEDYLKGVKADEKVFGKTGVTFDEKLMKSAIPVLQKHGVSVEVANELANAFAKAQMDGARELMKERATCMQKMNAASREKFSDEDFETINAGIDAHFKPGGVMNNVIRHSELGADIEFLSLMLEMGKAVKEDKVKGAASGAGEGGDANGIEGLSKMWH